VTELSSASIYHLKAHHDETFLCFHCGLSTKNPIQLSRDLTKSFCCHGCLSVFQIIEESKLDEYYSIKKDSDPSLFIPAPESKKNFKHFDEENFESDFVKKLDSEKSIKLYLEGVHCIACLWLIEKIPQILKGVLRANFDFDNSVVSITTTKGASLSEVAKLLDKLGYTPHPIKNDDEISKLKANEERSYLIKLGIAMACMGNILLFSISIYAGLEGNLKSTFNWLSFLISLPVVTFCAMPFYRSALSSLRNKKPNMDLPISVALIAGTGSGLFSLITNIGETYFDSLTSLVFLLLLSRYCLLKIRQQGVTSSNLEYFSSFGNVTVLKNLLTREGKTVLAKYVSINDLLQINEGGIIPADGVVIEGEAFLNTSLLTGESLPMRSSKDDFVFSGTEIISGELVIRVKETGVKTKLGRILSSVKKLSKKQTPFSSLSQKVSQFFISLVFLISLGTVAYFWQQGTPLVGITRALTLLIVTCPCALALATPLALTATLQKLLKVGIVLKTEDVVEKLHKARNIYLDKTGTLTEGHFQVIDLSLEMTPKLRSIIWTLEKRARHPIATALTSYIEGLGPVDEMKLKDWLETPGIGVSGVIDDQFYQLKRTKFYAGAGTSVSLYQDDDLLISIVLKDKARSDSKSIIDELKTMGLNPIIISGDTKKEVEDLALEVGINKDQVYSEISPEGKLALLTKDPNSIMVGDGANDAMALKKASIGIAVKGSLDISLEAADIYFTRAGISSLKNLINSSMTAIKVIKINMLFSLLFNLVGSYLALTGKITPLIAAVLMPLSSLSVLLSTYLFSKEKT
jgi:heavy metal translocating P-type ATPase